MFPLSYDGNAPIFPNEQFFGEIHTSSCFSTMPYEYDKDVLLPQHPNLLVYQQQPMRAYESTVAADTVQEGSNCREQAAAQECNKKTTYIAEKQIPKKKPAKKDRHSKIYTAQGPRDRRMRMSLEVAKQFFALQDMLGFNKASKTVEWLLIQAKDEITKLAGGGFPHLMKQSCSNNGTAKSASSTSESCEVVSGNDDSKQQKETSNVTMEKPLASFDKGKKRVKRQRKTAFQQVGKESREKARKRARERTREKMRSSGLNELNISDAIVNQECNNQGCSSCSPFESTARSHNTFEEVMLAEAELEPSSNKQVEEYMDDDPILIMGNWSPSLVFNYLQNN